MNLHHWLTDLRVTTVVVCLILSLLTAFTVAQRIESGHVTESKDKLAKRIALDLPELPLANPVFNQITDTHSVMGYMQALNHHLAQMQHPLRILRIQDVSLQVDNITDVIAVDLQTARQTIDVAFGQVRTGIAFSVVFAPLLFTFFVALLVYGNDKYHRARKHQGQPDLQVKSSKLVVNLRERTLYLSECQHTTSSLSNKPLCFYLAMLKYCQDNSEAKLYHNKNLPEDFVQLANKYFYRLLELGHSRRKRPDFDSNVDKMLSEIRAALDEILCHDVALKNKFYPQKAQGEGSRSKLHNFALRNLTEEDYELIGN
jgi:hypothetical protein